MPTPGWKGSDRRSRLPSDWAKIRERVKRRDLGLCQECGAPGTDVDHIRPGDDHSMSNLRLLCAACHKAKTAKEGGEAYAAKRRAINNRLRRSESHPGLL